MNHVTHCYIFDISGILRRSLVYKEKDRENAEFVMEEMNKEIAEIFTKLQLGVYIPG
jgi:hypothetical protein